MSAKVPVFEEKASDCYCTPDDVLDLVRGETGLWSYVDLDPFGDPEDRVDAAISWDVRLGQDAFKTPWINRWNDGLPGERPSRIFVNGPYSGQHPQLTASKCAAAYLAGAHVQSLCPAAPGSAYWRRNVWSLHPTIAWLGRLSFRAGRDIRNKAGEITAKKGQIVHGNRTEITMVYLGPERERFAALWESAGYAVTVTP